MGIILQFRSGVEAAASRPSDNRCRYCVVDLFDSSGKSPAERVIIHLIQPWLFRAVAGRSIYSLTYTDSTVILARRLPNVDLTASVIYGDQIGRCASFCMFFIDYNTHLSSAGLRGNITGSK
jgi:hypothetical protein